MTLVINRGKHLAGLIGKCQAGEDGDAMVRLLPHNMLMGIACIDKVLLGENLVRDFGFLQTNQIKVFLL